MDTRLIGKKIYVGREPGNARLKLLMQVEDTMKETTIGENDSVNSGVSRCLSAEKAHCCIEVCQNQRLTLTNMNENNVTILQGHYIASMTFELKPSTEVILGSEKYVLNLDAVLKAASSLLPQVFDIKPLENVWKEYDKSVKAFKVKQGKINALSTVTSVCMTMGAFLAFLFDNNSVRYPFMALGIAIAIIMQVYRYRAVEKNIKKEEEMKDKFISDYICPNPNCKHFLGTTPYRILRQNRACPYCKGKWVENQ